MFGSAYWSVYKRIEQEVIKLSYSIHFDDSQINVYSNQILDLIIRISTNIESLYEDIYRDELGKTESEIGLMITKLDETFSLENKIIYIANENFHFRKKLKKVKPFKYKKKSKDDFYSTYNALKHNRSANIKKANIYTLLRSLAAFYVLCVIFDNKWTPLQNSIYGSKTPYTFTYNSELFSAKVYDKQLAYAEQSIIFLAMKIDATNKSDKSCVTDMLSQCEKNLRIKFREQKPKECLFKAELTPEYLQSLDEFKKKYSKNNAVAEVELNLLFGDHDNEKIFGKLGIESLDVLMDHIKLNLEEHITTIVVNRDDGKDMFPALL